MLVSRGKGRSFWMAAIPDGLKADYQVIKEPGPFGWENTNEFKFL